MDEGTLALGIMDAGSLQRGAEVVLYCSRY